MNDPAKYDMVKNFFDFGATANATGSKTVVKPV